MGEMLLSISSNWINGLYSCLELLVVAIFSRCLATLIGCWNVKRIYADEKELELKGSPFIHFADLGLTSRRMQVVGVLSFSVVLGLMTAGGYSILGVTEKTYDETKVTNLVRLARPGEHLNFTENLSLETKQVSGNLLLLRDYTACVTRNLTVFTVYEYSNSMKDLAEPKWNVSQLLQNSTCMTDAEKFKNSILFRLDMSGLPEGYQDDCKWSVNGSTVPEGVMYRSPVVQSSSCRYPVIEAWCLRKDTTMNCVAISRLGDRFTLSSITGADPEFQTLRVSRRYQLPEQVETWRLQAIVWMLSVQLLPNPAELELLTRLTIETDATVLEKRGERDVTKVDVVLFLLTTGVACSITLIALVVAVYAYLRIVVNPGRKLCNRFNTAMDLINYAATLDPAGRHFSRTKRNRAVTIGIRTSDADVGPLAQ